jgi:hypothetical protein
MSEQSLFQLASVFLGGVIGVTGAVAAAVVPEAMRRRHEARMLSAAIVAEVRSILAIVAKRRYVEGLRAVLESAGNEVDPDTPHWLEFSLRHDPFAVYHANLSRIGMLKTPSPDRVVEFYACAKAVLEDIADFREGALARAGRDESRRRLEELYLLVLRVTETGKTIVDGS